MTCLVPDNLVGHRLSIPFSLLLWHDICKLLWKSHLQHSYSKPMISNCYCIRKYSSMHISFVRNRCLLPDVLQLLLQLTKWYILRNVPLFSIYSLQKLLFPYFVCIIITMIDFPTLLSCCHLSSIKHGCWPSATKDMEWSLGNTSLMHTYGYLSGAVEGQVFFLLLILWNCLGKSTRFQEASKSTEGTRRKCPRHLFLLL
jgi:hypothetical protein